MFNTSTDGRGEDMDMQFATLWESTADIMLDNPALICGDSVRSWKEYEERAARLAMLLTKHGLGDDSKVGLYLHNNNEYLEAQFSDIFRGEFGGIGAHVNINAEGKIMIVSPIEGSPAEKAGIKAGDVVLEVDGESLKGVGLLEAVNKIRGPKGSTVRLLIKHIFGNDWFSIFLRDCNITRFFFLKY